MKKLVFAVLLFASPALASDPVVCTLTTGTGAAASTAACTSGSATWLKNAYVLMQCTTDVYVSSTTPSGSAIVTPATSSSELVDFTNNKDKVGIPLGPREPPIRGLAATSGGTCKFMITNRKNPTK